MILDMSMSNGTNVNLSDDGFQKVTHKKKLWKSKATQDHKDQNFRSTYLNFDKEASIRRIYNAKSEILATDLFDSVTALLREGLSALKNSLISEIICFGLGKIGECTIARYQFALLLCLKELYNVNVYVYDPVFNDNDISLLNHFNVTVLEENLEGKYKIRNKETTLFYLPHCPKQMTNNLLWANWGLDLKYCIIVSNSFSKIIENSSNKTLSESAEYISKIAPYVHELAIVNSFKYYEIFNDTSIHVFPKMNMITPDLWEFCSEPKYLREDIEFITSDVNKLLI